MKFDLDAFKSKAAKLGILDRFDFNTQLLDEEDQQTIKQDLGFTFLLPIACCPEDNYNVFFYAVATQAKTGFYIENDDFMHYFPTLKDFVSWKPVCTYALTEAVEQDDPFALV